MAPDTQGSPFEVFAAFLKLGVASFGGPVAHIGYFRNEFVQRRAWLDERAYADLVALCQFLPGPASSQVGFSIGLMRAGYAGGLAAWTGFTVPSAILMVLFAYGAGALGGPLGMGVLHGLKLVAVAIVAQAVWGMARSLCPDRTRATIAGVATILNLFGASGLVQVGTILLGALAGWVVCREAQGAPAGKLSIPVSYKVGFGAAALYLLLLIVLPALPGLALVDAFYRSGALVFGGGHVVLPLLREAVVAPGWVGDDAFLAGYGAAQAVPGPLFTFSAYLGAMAGGLPGAAIGLVAIFLPGMLALIGALPFWDLLRTKVSAQAVMRGVNAAVVGLLGAALYNPVWTGSVKAPADFAIALAGFVLLTVWKAPPLVVVILSAAAGGALAVL